MAFISSGLVASMCGIRMHVILMVECPYKRVHTTFFVYVRGCKTLAEMLCVLRCIYKDTANACNIRLHTGARHRCMCSHFLMHSSLGCWCYILLPSIGGAGKLAEPSYNPVLCKNSSYQQVRSVVMHVCPDTLWRLVSTIPVHTNNT